MLVTTSTTMTTLASTHYPMAIILGAQMPDHECQDSDTQASYYDINHYYSSHSLHHLHGTQLY